MSGARQILGELHGGGATGVPYCVQLCLDGLGSIASTRSFTLSCGCFPSAGLYYGVIMFFFSFFSHDVYFLLLVSISILTNFNLDNE